MNGKRWVKSFALRVISRTPAASLRAMMRKPSCLISCSQPEPEGGALAGEGRHGSMMPKPGRVGSPMSLRDAAEKETATRRATDAQVLEDAERLIGAWNERQALRAPMIFSPTIGAAIRAGYWFLWVRCPACRTINAIDLRTLDRHPDAAVTSLIPALSCRSCRPNAPFAELVQLSRTSIADEMREQHRRRVLGE